MFFFPYQWVDHKSPSAGKFLVSYNIPSRSFPVTKSRNGQLITPRLFLPHLPCHTALNAKPFLPPTLSKIESEASSVHRSVATSSKPSFPPSCQLIHSTWMSQPCRRGPKIDRSDFRTLLPYSRFIISISEKITVTLTWLLFYCDGVPLFEKVVSSSSPRNLPMLCHLRWGVTA